MTQEKSPALEMWAGLECTLNRVGDRFVDQCLLNGHDRRITNDLERFAALGIKKLRYPVLWEKIEGRGWTQTDDALAELRRLDVEPIVGLVHHGSGPSSTSLLDPEFPEKLAAFAAEVVERYGWVRFFNPVNEPLTTARFSGLYGFWYPHKSDDASFVRALYHQLRGVVLAMRAIREKNPRAQLVQTEDLGRAKATPPLQYQVDFENRRRWLTFDFLCGRVDETHLLYPYLRDRGGLSHEEILWFKENSCMPDVIGINHYPLSNRFLDHRVELYPDVFRGGNGRDTYVDVGAVDTGQTTPPLPIEVLREVWDRYRLPLAVTEAHISGPRESQMRWLNELWTAAQELRQDGVELRAVTAWSLLGSYGWTSLCTCEPGHEVYESGIFDNRSTEPRETAIARMVRSYASTSSFEHPLLERAGYWRDPSRAPFAPSNVKPISSRRSSRPLVIMGANGLLGQAFVRVCEWRGIDAVAMNRLQVDIANPFQVRAVLKNLNPWAVVNAAGYSRIDSAERDRERCYRENTEGAATLAQACAETQTALLTFSTDHVFDGTQSAPYGESALVRPLNVYGRSKADSEAVVREKHEEALIVRTSSLFSAWTRSNFWAETLARLQRRQPVYAAEDLIASPTYVVDLVNAALDLLIDGERGLAHLSNESAVSHSEWAELAADLIRAPRDLIIKCHAGSLRFAAPRARYTALKSETYGPLMPNLEGALRTFVHESTKMGVL